MIGSPQDYWSNCGRLSLVSAEVLVRWDFWWWPSGRSPSLRTMDERTRQGQRIPRTQFQVDRSGDDGPFADDVDVYPPPVLMERRRRHPEPTVAAARLGILEGKLDHVLTSR